MFITEAVHYGDPVSQRFFMRTAFTTGEFTPAVDAFTERFSRIAKRFQMVRGLHDGDRKERVLILVSKFDHCLNDLLYRYRTGDLAIEVPAVVSNHADLAPLAEWHGIPFHHPPVTPETKREQETAMLRLVDELDVDLVVLALYMGLLKKSGGCDSLLRYVVFDLRKLRDVGAEEPGSVGIVRHGLA